MTGKNIVILLMIEVSLQISGCASIAEKQQL
jgi:hypothetical protein